MSNRIDIGYSSPDLSVDSITVSREGGEVVFDPDANYKGSFFDSNKPRAEVVVDGTVIGSSDISTGGSISPRTDSLIGVSSVVWRVTDAPVSVDVTDVVGRLTPSVEPADIQIQTVELFGEVRQVGNNVTFIGGETLSEGRLAAFRVQLRNYGGETGTINLTGSVDGQQVVDEVLSVEPTGGSIERGLTFTTPSLSGETVPWSVAGESGTARNEDFSRGGGGGSGGDPGGGGGGDTSGGGEIEIADVAVSEEPDGVRALVTIENKAAQRNVGRVAISVDGVVRDRFELQLSGGGAYTFDKTYEVSATPGQEVEVCAEII